MSSFLEGDGSDQYYPIHTSALLNEDIIMVQPSLAVAIGLKEAIILQQLHYWSSPNRKSGKVVEGRRWLYNTYKEWQGQHFPFWTEKQIADGFRRLEELDIILSRQDLNSEGFNRRKWYAIDYNHSIFAGTMQGTSTYDGTYTDVGSTYAEVPSSITETTTETTTENAVSSETGLAGLDSLQSSLKKKSANPQPPNPPAPAKDDRRVWGMVDSYFDARGLEGHKMPKSQRHAAYNVFRELGPEYGATAVYGCASYLASQQWYQEPGRLTAKAVSNAIYEWDKKGRPTAEAPRAGQKTAFGFANTFQSIASSMKEHGL